MNNHKVSKKGGLIVIAGIIIAQVIVKVIGAENIPLKLVLALVAAACTAVIIGVIKNGKKGYGIKYNITFTILVLVFLISFSATMILFKGDSELFKYGLYMLELSMVSIVLLAIFVVVYDVTHRMKDR
ncbi:hypothetical protein [Clostridium sp. JN-9]|uniref:hypothetical protein n=1 Tax=Clostridium sp. JN-9 TaxID=2507159 RepID=UPI000FFE249B|nr:hypothetical protein [Clostridium sp. JN-9]QAT39825.1 hypothetical protein EQM05_05925 [Clostridium sp. JN-9]